MRDDERKSGTAEGRALALLAERGLRLATAESCTGGGIGARITAVPGASEHYVGGVVSYANEVKTGVLGVDPAVLERHGAVSEPVVRQMARGAARLCGAECAVSVSGIAGPGGGTPEKPVGTVWMARSTRRRSPFWSSSRGPWRGKSTSPPKKAKKSCTFEQYLLDFRQQEQQECLKWRRKNRKPTPTSSPKR